MWSKELSYGMMKIKSLAIKNRTSCGDWGVCSIQSNIFKKSRSLVNYQKFDRNQDHTLIDETRSYWIAPEVSIN